MGWSWKFINNNHKIHENFPIRSKAENTFELGHTFEEDEVGNTLAKRMTFIPCSHLQSLMKVKLTKMNPR